MFPIYKREMRAYFTSPIGYVFVAIFLALSGVIFSYATVWSATSDATGYFSLMMFLFIILVPVLTMKLFSEERKMKTEQILLTSPVSLWGITFGKFLAAFSMFAVTFLLSCLINFVAIATVAQGGLNLSTVFGSIVGMMLLGGVFVAIGLFVSALTENQLIAAVSTFGIIILMFCLNLVQTYIGSPAVRYVISWFSIIERFSYFTNGIFSLPSIIYYISMIFIFLFVTVQVYEKRRWG